MDDTDISYATQLGNMLINGVSLTIGEDVAHYAEYCKDCKKWHHYTNIDNTDISLKKIYKCDEQSIIDRFKVDENKK